MMKAKKGNSYGHESKTSNNAFRIGNKGLEKDHNIGAWDVRTLLQRNKHY